MNHAKQPGGLRCHAPYACALGQKPCPTPTECNCAPTGQELESQREKAAQHYGTMAREARAAAKYQCADCKTPLRPGYICGACDSFGAKEIEAPALQAAPPAPAAVAVPKFDEWREREYPWRGPIGDGVQMAREAWDAALAAAPAQEHTTQLAGQGQEASVAQALDEAETERCKSGAGTLMDCLSASCNVVRARAAAPAQAQEDARDARIAKLTTAYTELSSMFHDQIVAQQAAWIEWQHGQGAEEAMSWIENGLCGPGHIPDEDAPYGKEAQAWFDANKSDPFPVCHCGRPSNQLWMGQGFCSNAHYDAARAAQGEKA